MSQKLDDLLRIIGLIEDDKIDCCEEAYRELCDLYDKLEEEEKIEQQSYDEGPAYEDRYDI